MRLGLAALALFLRGVSIGPHRQRLLAVAAAAHDVGVFGAAAAAAAAFCAPSASESAAAAVAAATSAVF